MKYQLSTLGLIPFIIAQALYLKRVTPRLPEAEGHRFGAEGVGSALGVLI